MIASAMDAVHNITGLKLPVSAAIKNKVKMERSGAWPVEPSFLTAGVQASYEPDTSYSAPNHLS
jgi:hypothetical protein